LLLFFKKDGFLFFFEKQHQKTFDLSAPVAPATQLQYQRAPNTKRAEPE